VDTERLSVLLMTSIARCWRIGLLYASGTYPMEVGGSVIPTFLPVKSVPRQSVKAVNHA